MTKRNFKIKLTYFKSSGKYYADSKCEVMAGEIVMGEGTPNAYPIAYTYDVLDAVALMPEHPGLSGRWTEGPILVEGPEMSPPHLITDLEGLAQRAKYRQYADVVIQRTSELAQRPFEPICAKCGGTGEVHGVGSHAFACPRCNGSGR